MVACPERLPMSARSGSIDSLRGVAVLLVLEEHFLRLTGVYDLIGAPAWAIRLAAGGANGVDLFFVLSSYLLADGLLRRAHEPRAISTFYLRRAFRVLPMYWIVVAAGFGLYGLWMSTFAIRSTWLWAAPYPAWAYLLFVQNWWNGITGAVASWFGPTWPLAIEEQFYLLLPLLALRLGPRGLALVALVWIVGAPAARVASETAVAPYASYYWTVCRLDSFGWGLLIALAPRLAPALAARLPALPMRLGGVFIALATLALSQKATALERSVTASLMTFAAALIVASVVAQRKGGTARGWRLLAWCGARCYSLYLLQMPMLGLVFLAAGHLGPNAAAPGGLALIACATAATFMLADVAWRRVEQPFMAMAERLAPHRRAPAAIALPARAATGQPVA